MFNSENLHKNHKLAFLDGLLCGIAISHIAKQFYNDYREMKELDALAAESRAVKNNVEKNFPDA